MVKGANTQLCLKFVTSPGQKPRPAWISPSAARELWFDPIVAPAAIFAWPAIKFAIKNELLWCCSWNGNSKLCRISAQDTFEFGPIYVWITRAFKLRDTFLPVAELSTLTPFSIRLFGPIMLFNRFVLLQTSVYWWKDMHTYSLNFPHCL